MTTTSSGRTPTTNAIPDLTLRGRSPTLRRPRNLPGAALGVLVVLVCSLLVATLASSGSSRTDVLVITHPVASGTVIRAGDLGVTGVAAGHAVRAMPGADRSTVVGRTAAENLAPGTVLVPSQLGSGPAVRSGSVVSGLAVKPGAMPADLAPGDEVEILDTPSASGGGAGSASVLVRAARVLSVGADPSGDSSLVSVVIPDGSAGAVTEANAGGDVSLVVMGG